MKILAIEKELPGVKEEDYKPHLKSEAQKAWDFYKAGVIRELYFTDKHTAILIIECADSDEAKEILSELPLVKNHFITFDLYPLLPYPGFERLFESK